MTDNDTTSGDFFDDLPTRREEFRNREEAWQRKEEAGLPITPSRRDQAAHFEELSSLIRSGVDLLYEEELVAFHRIGGRVMALLGYRLDPATGELQHDPEAAGKFGTRTLEEIATAVFPMEMDEETSARHLADCFAFHRVFPAALVTRLARSPTRRDLPVACWKEIQQLLRLGGIDDSKRRGLVEIAISSGRRLGQILKNWKTGRDTVTARALARADD